MRHFIVLGFRTIANSEQGEPVHLGCDRGEAIERVNDIDDRFVRQQLFELAVPQLSRHSIPTETEPEPNGDQPPTAGVPDDVLGDAPEETETNVDEQSPTFADVPGHDALVAAGIDSFDKLTEAMKAENWQKPITGIGNGIARQIVAFVSTTTAQTP